MATQEKQDQVCGPRHAAHDPNLKLDVRMLHMLLWDEQDKAKGNLVSNQGQLADEFGVSLTTLKRGMNALRDAGYISTEQTFPHGGKFGGVQITVRERPHPASSPR